MAKTKPLTFDPARLLVLARTRDTHRAQLVGLADRYDALRESLNDTRRRAALARENAQHAHGPARAEGEKNAAALEARTAEILAEMAELQAQIDAAAAATSDAGQCLSRALEFAKAEKLTIPRALAETGTPAQAMGA